MDPNSTLLQNPLVNSSKFASAPLPVIYYSWPYRLIGTIAGILALIAGLSGNLLVITVIMWSYKLRSPTNCYLVSLSFSDMLFLLHATAPFIWELYVMIGEWKLGTHACRIMVAMQYLCTDTSALSMAAFSVERWVAICHPMRAQTLCTVNRALKIITAIWIFCACYNCVWLFTTETHVVKYVYGTFQTCTYKFSRMRYSTVYLLDFFLFYLLPLCLIFAMYLQITLRLYKFNKPSCLALNQAKTGDKGSGFRRANQLGRQICVESNLPELPRPDRRHYRYRKQVVKMLMTVVVLFAIFWFPYRSLMVYNSFATPKRTDYWLLLFVRTMAYLNSTVNPILYNAMSKKFRRTFRLLILQAPCFGRRKMNIILNSRRTECMRSRDYFRQIHQQQQRIQNTMNQNNQIDTAVESETRPSNA